MGRKYGKSQSRKRVRALVLATETHCYLCGEPVDKKLPAGHPASAEIDDIVPVSKGGNPLDRDNLRLAHKSCNVRKSNKSLALHQELTANVTVSRKW